MILGGSRARQFAACPRITALQPGYGAAAGPRVLAQRTRRVQAIAVLQTAARLRLPSPDPQDSARVLRAMAHG
jgi:hypothetical protein